MPTSKKPIPAHIQSLLERREKGDSLRPSEWAELEKSGWVPEPADMETAREIFLQGPPFDRQATHLIVRGTPLTPMKGDELEHKMLEFERRVRRYKPELDAVEQFARQESERIFGERIREAEEAQRRAREKMDEIAKKLHAASEKLRYLEGVTRTVVPLDGGEVRTEVVVPRSGSATEISLARAEVQELRPALAAAENDVQRRLVAKNALLHERDRYRHALRVARSTAEAAT